MWCCARAVRTRPLLLNLPCRSARRALARANRGSYRRHLLVPPALLNWIFVVDEFAIVKRPRSINTKSDAANPTRRHALGGSLPMSESGSVSVSAKANSTVLRSKTPDLVQQELWGLLLAHFAIRQLMTQAAWPRGLDPDRLSFTHAVRVIERKMPQAAAVPP
jgi:hypothetical protein